MPAGAAAAGVTGTSPSGPNSPHPVPAPGHPDGHAGAAPHGPLPAPGPGGAAQVTGGPGAAAAGVAGGGVVSSQLSWEVRLPLYDPATVLSAAVVEVQNLSVSCVCG